MKVAKINIENLQPAGYFDFLFGSSTENLLKVVKGGKQDGLSISEIVDIWNRWDRYVGKGKEQLTVTEVENE